MSEIATPRDIVTDIINNRVGRSTISPYMNVVNAVIEAMEQRDESIADTLRVIGTREELDPRKVEAALVECGLAKEAEEEDEADDDTPAWARGLVERIEGIERHLGMRGRPVGD